MYVIVACRSSTELTNGEMADAIDVGFWGAYSVATTSSNATRIAWEWTGRASRVVLFVDCSGFASRSTCTRLCSKVVKRRRGCI